MLLAASAFFAGIVLAGILGGIAIAVTGDDDGPLLLAAGFVGLWIPLVGASFLASTAFGTRSPSRDLGLRIEPGDLWRGLFVGLAGLLTASAVQFLLSHVASDLVGSNTSFIDDQAKTSFGTTIVVISTLLGAPFVEELFFRGLLLRSLARFGVVAVVVQALVFGLIHFTPDEGIGNVGIILGIGAFGLVLGLAAHRFGRLGPSMIGHLVFNAAAVVPLLVSR